MKTSVHFNNRPTPHWRIDYEYHGMTDTIHIYTENTSLTEEEVESMAKGLRDYYDQTVQTA